MEKKIKFSDQPKKVKIVYASVIAVLCITAVVIGIVSASQKNNDLPDDMPSASVPDTDSSLDTGKQEEQPGESEGEKEDEGEKEEQKPTKLTMVSPVVGRITKGHSLDMPVFSNTLNEWRVHTGIDISADDGAKVYASAGGVVTKVYSDPFLGKTVEIDHGNDVVSIYSNLSAEGIAVKEGDAISSGALIGLVGDTSISELADEPHLHFAVKVNGVSVNPLDYISDESKSASLGLEV
jgi:murein DD-endopeptidase MepM/ murein hydrolase activator NlpD